jgi:hypothetical protein
LPLWINSVSEPILFTDVTGVIISSRNFENFCWVSNLFLSDVINQFAANKIINLHKICIMKFIIKNSSHSTLHIGYKETFVEETVHTKFLGSQIWKPHKLK